MGTPLKLRWAVAWTIGLLFASLGQSAAALATERLGEGNSSDASLLTGPLVVSSVDALLGGQEQSAAREARRSGPQAVAERAAARFRYEGLSPTRAAGEAATAFPGLVARPAASTPRLASGQRILRYATDHAAQVSLPAGKGIGMIESLAPIAAKTPGGRHLPLDLRLRAGGGHFEPVRSDVAVQVPTRLADGISLPAAGVSVTPVDAHGVPLAASSGALAGSTVLWDSPGAGAGRVRDLSTLAKASPEGFELTTMLFSQRSPGDLYFRVHMPAGARLSSQSDGSVRIVRAAKTLATVSPVSAEDAEGSPVPVTMTLSGDTLHLTVERSGDYLYPIAVDPEVNDSQLAKTSAGKRSNWEFFTSNASRFQKTETYEGPGVERLETKGIAEYALGEWAYWGYQTKGVSHIYEVKTETAAHNKNAKLESFLEFQEPGGSRETKKLLSTETEGTSEYEKKAATLCAANASKVEECLPGAGKAKNAIHFQQSATASPGANYKFSDTMSQGIVSIAEPTGTHSTTSYNTTSPTLEFEVELEGKKQKVKRTNALYGSGVWLSKSAGALELLANDTGIGVSLTKLEYESSAGHWTQLGEHNYLGVENACQGIQCYASHAEFWTLPTGLPDGEQKLRYKAEEAIAGTQSLEGEGRATVKVDTAAPHGLSIAGLPFGNELSERPYKLTATAIDGSGATLASSGVKRLALFVSGREVAEVGTQTGCFAAIGECLAKAEWSINGSELGAGRHAIVIVATDNAGNESRIEETISIRHSTPVPIGPGSVDLQSGDFTLGATDVSLGSGLTVSRSYSSRATLAGAEGRLGPQWSMSLGANESIRELVDGGVLLTSASGKQSIFASLGQGKFEAPNGDSNLKLELEENKTTKEKLAYYLKNAAAGTSEKFTLPAGSRVWLPTKQEGTLATDTVTYGYAAVDHEDRFALPGSEPQPGAIATGPDGYVWSADTHTHKIDKLSQTGVVLAEYSTSGTPGPNIVTGPDGRLWFVEGENAVGKKYTAVKMTTAGAQTEYALPGGAAYLTAGADGNMWFTDSEDKKVGKITPNGASSLYAVPHGTPYAATAGTDGNVWFLTTNPSRIDKVTPAGVVTEMYTPPTEFAQAEAIATGSDGNVWFSETGKIDKITPAGVVTAYPLASAERVVNSIAAGPDKNVWFSDNGRLGKVTPAGVRTDYAVGAQSYGMTAGPDGNIWYTDDSHGTVDRSTTSGKIVEPSEILAPVPPGVSCAPEMKPGCRALHFSYGGPNGLLSGVSLEAYNPESKRMVSENVAAYGYDAKGQLHEEWDPRHEAVKVRYRYDPEGHLTALSPPGQEPWFFVYGTIQGDLGSGRLMKVSRAPASEPIRGGGEDPPVNKEKPSITGSALTGVRMTTSDGEWSLAPLAYGYQWQDCDASGGACTVIAGANGSSYTPTAADVGHEIVAVVTATNGTGSATSSSEPTGVVASRTIEFASESKPRGLTPGPVMPKGTEWYTAANSIMKEKTAEAAETKYELPAESTPYDITAGPDGNLWYTEFSLRGKIGRITTSGVRTEYALPVLSYPDEITAGSDGKLWFTEEESGKIGKITTAGAVTEYALPAGSHPTAITSGSEGNLWFVKETKIGRITTTGSITEYALPAGSKARGIAAGSDGNLWFTEYGTDKIGKITTAGSITEFQLPTGSQPSGIVAAGDGNLWFTEYGSSKIGRITTAGAIAETPLPPGSGPLRIARGANSDLEYTDNLSSRIGHLTIGTEAAERTPSMGWTIEYGTPLTAGAGLPAMTPGDVAKWGQTDSPVEATAILPPDADQGWPATSYKRAIVYYLDAHGRNVNVSQPSNAPYGSVATTEFNETNDPIRTLSPDNRQAALEAGASSVEVSKLLDTQSTYNGEGAKEGEAEEPGTRLIESFGPQHMIKYVAGHEQKEMLGRDHKEFSYDQGAPGGETYDLVTESSDLARLANKEDVEVRTTKTSYSGQGNLGWKLRAPTTVMTVDPEGHPLTRSTTEYNAATGQISEVRGTAADVTLSYATKFGEAGTEAGKLKSPWGVAVTSEGRLLVVDSANNRIEQFSAEGAYVSSFGGSGSGNGQLKEPEGIALDSSGHIWVADTANNRIEEFSSTGAFMSTVGSLGSESGRFKTPAALAFDSKGNMWVADTGNSRIEKFDKEARYSSEFSSAGSEPGKLKEPKGIAVDSGEHVWVADTANNRIQEFSTTGSLLKRFGGPGVGEGQLNTPIDLKIDSQGNLWTVDSLNNRAESFSPTGAYVTQIGWKGTEAGQLTGPRSLAFDATGKAWVTDSSNNRLEQWSKGPNAHDQKTIYYSATANTEGYAACGSHPEWAGLVCETLPAKQPELMSLPKLPVTSFTYNIYDEPETITEAFGSTTRTKKETYDAAGRRSSSETTATTGVSLPKVSFTYNPEQGVLEQQTTSGEEKTLKSEFNRLGQLVKYTDANGNVASYKYAGPENDFLLTEASDSSAAGTSKQSYEYDATTKLRTKLIDSAAGSFTASYDAEGKMTSVSYPYGICANYGYNSGGEATSVQYLKTSNCSASEPGIYYSDSRVSSVRGELLSQSSTLAGESYAYDASGRLSETQETPAGEGCKVRAYAYDEEGNRASSASRVPGAGGACQSEGGTVEAHNYDEANRLADGGMAYDGLGNVTKLPAADAEGHELTSTFYVDNAVASQTQSGITNEYKLDPEGRTRETITGSTKTINHYDGSGEAVAWSESPEKSVRNIAGIDGALLATQTNGETPVLQLHDLQGDVVATIGDKAGETKLLSSYNSTEFGVPNAGKAPPKFAYLGALGVESSFSTGVITYGATSYVPQTGRALQSEAVEAPGVGGGSGAGALYTMQEEPWNMRGAARAGAEAPGLEAAREQAAWEAAFAAAQNVDPHLLFTLADARIKGEQFLKIATASEIISVIGSIPDQILDKVAGLIFDHFSVDIALDWYHKAGQKLVECSHLYSKGFRRCLFGYTNTTISLGPVSATFVNLGIAPEVEKCAPPLFAVPGQPYSWRCERLGENSIWIPK